MAPSGWAREGQRIVGATADKKTAREGAWAAMASAAFQLLSCPDTMGG